MYNEKKLILDTLRALERQRFDEAFHREILRGFRVILIDNNSTDDTAQIVTDFIEAGTPPGETSQLRRRGQQHGHRRGAGRHRHSLTHDDRS
jgi:glycosyltransferase involved in cell wall biosynthesis